MNAAAMWSLMSLKRLPVGSNQKGRLRGRGLRILGMAIYLTAMAGIVYGCAPAVDRFVGWLLPVSPWPPVALNNLPLYEETFQSYDFEWVHRTNSLGLRGNEIPPKQADVFRILAIGDSYVYGWGVNQEDTWCERLERLFRDAGRRVEVINGGMLGNGPVEYAMRAEYLIPALRPDLTLVCILQGSDIVETPVDRSRLPNLGVLAKNWKFRTPRPIPTTVNRMTRETKRMYSIQFAESEFRQMTDDQRRRFDRLDDVVKQHYFKGSFNAGMIAGALKWPGWYVELTQRDPHSTQHRTQTLAAMLLRIRRIADRYAGRVFTVIMPEGPFVNRAAIANWGRLGFDMSPLLYGNEETERIIRSSSEKAGIGVFDLAPAFRENGDKPELFFVLDTHMAPPGHVLVAQTLHMFLSADAAVRALPRGTPNVR